MTLSLDSARAIVTGGASGLGFAVAQRIAGQGGHVVLADVDDARGAYSAERLGKQTLFVRCDVASEESVSRAVAQAVEHLRGITLAVNCAGVLSAQRVVGRDELISPDVFRRVIDINLTGTFFVCRATAYAMQHNAPQGEDGERGVIVNTASVAAFEGQIGQVPYAASKGGVASMTLPMAREFAAFGVRVVTIAPGVFRTPMFERFPEPVRDGLAGDTPFPKRAGQPEEFACLVEHIYQNPMLNGEVIRLDGALRMPPKSRSPT